MENKYDNIVVCIKDFLTNNYRFREYEKYSVMDDGEQSIQIIDDYGNGIAIDKQLIFTQNFKYLSDMRSDKIKELGI
jgi:hypothetical protein